MTTRCATDTMQTSGRPFRLPEHTFLDTRDVDEAETVIGSALSDGRIMVDRPNRDFRLQVRDCRVGDLWLAHFTCGAAISVQSMPLDCYAFNLTLRGRSETRHGAGSMTATANRAAMLSPFSETSFTWSMGTEVLCVRIPRSALDQLFRKISGATGSIRFDMSVAAGSAPWLRSALGYALSASSDAATSMPNALSWQLRDSVLTALLLELSHDRQDLVLDQNSTRTSRVCDAAIAMMSGELATPPSIPAIARRLRVSERSLQVSFREHLGVTPSAKFKQLRLHAVRDALLRGDAQRHTVARLATDVGGFTHLGRFAQEYLAMFGEHPSETLRA